MFENLIAMNARENASLNDGHTVCAAIKAAGLSANPRLYGNQFASGASSAGMVPETATQDNSDLPGPAQTPALQLNLATNADGSNNPLPPDLPVYLQVWVVERGNFYDVADIVRYTSWGIPLSQALS
jgi:hypothetical protein